MMKPHIWTMDIKWSQWRRPL